MNVRSMSTEELVRQAPYGNAWLEEMRRRLTDQLEPEIAPAGVKEESDAFQRGYEVGYTQGYESGLKDCTSDGP